MNKRIIPVILILLLSLNAALCQKSTTGSGPILFRGVIIDAASLSRLGSSQILINRSGLVVGAEDGTFSFYASKRDTITFTILGYKPATLIVSDTISGSEFLTGVYLNADTMIIGDVIIVPRMTNLKAEINNPTISVNPKLENARSNISIASYQGRTSQGKLGDPELNYEILRQRQKINAYEKGGIPSDRILGLSPFLLIPAAYMLLHGVPEKPVPPKSRISSKDLEELKQRYLETMRNRK